MAKRAAKTKRSTRKKPGLARRFLAWFFGWELIKRAFRWALRGVGLAAVLAVALVALFAVVAPPTTPYILAERLRLGEVERDWVPLEDLAPVLARSVVAAEDANYCLHWGFDMSAIRAAIEDGATRGASTLSQQTVKNVFLWQGRSWPRKALEAILTPVVEAMWSKARIVEVYLNVAEFDEGVFGAGAAARHYFGKDPGQLSAREAALLAAVLPDPKGRSARQPSAFVSERARAIADGAATIAADGRAECFQPV
ncbi:MAG: monofunctional biosynthetic peptidoglycan transglycosylase [Paracoccaceae bacterium]|nr:monofunctional biosynthetic peptidoglycan transglycosylase [Paracoccaceae bacterium]